MTNITNKNNFLSTPHKWRTLSLNSAHTKLLNQNKWQTYQPCCRNTSVHTQVQLAANPGHCPHGTKEQCVMSHDCLSQWNNHIEIYVPTEVWYIWQWEWEQKHYGLVKKHDIKFWCIFSFFNCIHDHVYFRKIPVFCNVMLCCMVGCYQRSEGTAVSRHENNVVHKQGQWVSGPDQTNRRRKIQRETTLFPVVPTEWKMAVIRANILLIPFCMLKDLVLAPHFPTSGPLH